MSVGIAATDEGTYFAWQGTRLARRGPEGESSLLLSGSGSG